MINATHAAIKPSQIRSPLTDAEGQPMSQREWVAARVGLAQEGDDKALGDLYLMFCSPQGGQGVQWLKSLRMNPDEAWDLAVEVFFRCLRCFSPEHKSRACFKTYYFQALKLELMKSRRRRSVPLEDMSSVVDPDLTPSRLVMKGEMLDHLKCGLKAMEPTIARFLMAHLGHGVPMSHAYRITTYSYDYCRRMKPVWMERLRQAMDREIRTAAS